MRPVINKVKFSPEIDVTPSRNETLVIGFDLEDFWASIPKNVPKNLLNFLEHFKIFF